MGAQSFLGAFLGALYVGLIVKWPTINILKRLFESSSGTTFWR